MLRADINWDPCCPERTAGLGTEPSQPAASSAPGTETLGDGTEVFCLLLLCFKRTKDALVWPSIMHEYLQFQN